MALFGRGGRAEAHRGEASEIVLPVGGGCMRPWIWPGGNVHVRRCRMEELRIGDIAVWFDGANLLSHRVVAMREGEFVTNVSPSVRAKREPRPRAFGSRQRISAC